MLQPSVQHRLNQVTVDADAEATSENAALPFTCFQPDPQQLLTEMRHITQQRDAAFAQIHKLQTCLDVAVMSAASVESDDVKC